MKKYLCIIALVTAVLATPIVITSLPSDVAISVQMPDAYGVGELVTIDASASEADILVWNILPETPNFVINGKIATFCSPEPIDYTLVISATNSGKLISKVYSLTPEGKKKVVAPALSVFALKVQSWIPAGATKNAALAQSFEIVASLIEVDAFANTEALMLATVRANKDALGPELDNWIPFFAELEEY